MTREEAIEVYNGLLNQKIKEAFEFFAPELAVSEDERIRKEIRDFILYNAGKDITEETEHRWVTWLEKQKELDKMIVVSPEVWDNAISDAYENGKKDNEKQKKQKPYEPKNWPADKDNLTQEQKPNFDTHWENGSMVCEPKPAEWSEEDEINVGWLISYLKGENAGEYYDEMMRESLVDWLKSLRPSWKPSEEQMEPEYYQHFDPDC